MTTRRITAAHRQFNGIHHVAPVCISTECVLPFTHPSPDLYRLASIAVFCTAQCRDSPYFTNNGPPLFPLKLPLPMGESGLPPNTWFLGPTQGLNPNGISIGSAVFAQLTAERPYSLQRAAVPPQSAPSRGGIWTPI